jgi:hypothetical protein
MVKKEVSLNGITDTPLGSSPTNDHNPLTNIKNMTDKIFSKDKMENNYDQADC